MAHKISENITTSSCESTLAGSGRKEQGEQDRVLVPVAWTAPGWAARMIQS